MSPCCSTGQGARACIMEHNHKGVTAMSTTKCLALIVSFFVSLTPRGSRGAGWYVDASVPESGDGRTWGTAFKRIQEGIDAASDGDAVIVAQGTYITHIWFRGRNIAVQSTDPLDPGVVASTVIDAGGGASAVTFYGTEGESCVLSGFTIQNAKGSDGAISGRYWGGVACATIENNVIRDNAGAGLAYCNGTIRNNTISGNSSAGLYQCNALIQGNVISRNSSDPFSRGGVCECIGTIENNVITDNRAACAGGGLSNSDGIIRNNIIADNSANSGGGLSLCAGIIEGNTICGNHASGGCYKQKAVGGGLAYCAGRIRNNIVFGNSADYGGGLYDCDAILENNTICFNEADREGGGLHGCQAEIRNCIIWGNKASALYGPQLYLSDDPSYSCIQDWTGGGEGNIAEDPQFVDPDGPDNSVRTYEDNDFRLLPGSPCIDAGFNDPELPETDIAGMHRIMFGGKSLTVDMGAYEYFINELRPGPNPDETTLTWRSLADKTYSIFYSSDLFTWHLAVENFPSSGNQTTSWLDDGSLTGLPPGQVPRRFYRLLENP